MKTKLMGCLFVGLAFSLTLAISARQGAEPIEQTGIPISLPGDETQVQEDQLRNSSGVKAPINLIGVIAVVIDAETSTWLQNVPDIRGKNPAAFAETNHIFTIVQINAAIVAAPATDDSTCTQFGLRGRGCIAVFAHADEGDDKK